MRSLLLRSLGLATRVLKATPLVHSSAAKQAYYRLYRTLRPVGLQTVALDGAQLLLDPADEGLASFLLTTGAYEPYETGLIRRLLRPGDTAVDVGANIGYHAVYMGRAVGPQGRVFSIEPCRENHRLLVRNLALNGLNGIVDARLCAAGSAPGVAALCRHPTSSGGHTLSPAAGGESAGETVEVLPVDDILPDGARVRVAKLDAQGSELNVLQGMTHLLARSPDIHVFTEYWPAALRACGSDPLDLAAFVQSQGFRAFAVSEAAARLSPLTNEQLRALAASSREHNLMLVREPERSPALAPDV